MSAAGVVVIIGVGELGALFAQGLLKTGHGVVPVLRGSRPSDVARAHPEPELVLITVGEDDLASVLETLPAGWRDRVGLLQNELLPDVWRARRIERPTVAVVWFEKKAGRQVHELMPSVLGGPSAPLLRSALERVGLKATIVASEAELLRALVEKNLYILTTNIAGLETGGTVGELWQDHRALALAVAEDVLSLQRARTGAPLPSAELHAAFERAVEADPDHACTGRTAPARLARALSSAAALGLEVPALARIAAERARDTPKP